MWLNENIGGIGVVKIGTHLYDDRGNFLDLDYSRDYFENPVEPGQTLDKTIKINFADTGIYKLCIDLVSEDICWFENMGSKPQFISVSVK